MLQLPNYILHSAKTKTRKTYVYFKYICVLIKSFLLNIQSFKLDKGKSNQDFVLRLDLARYNKSSK